MEYFSPHESFNTTQDHFKERSFICACGRQFKKASQLSYHIRRIHNKEKNHVCSICNKAFFKKSDLDDHELTHKNEYKCICKSCGKSFKHISNLNRHIRTHTGVKPYPCSVCSKRFSQVSALQQHFQTEQHKAKLAESKKNENPVVLPVTDLGFVDPDDPESDEKPLESYIESSNNSNASKKWWFYCGVCNARFQFMHQLRSHEEKHVLNNDLTCRSCDIVFKCIKELISHVCGTPTSEDNKTTSSSVSDKPSQNYVAENKICNNVTQSTSTSNNNSTSDIELTLAGNGQILLDNKEVLLIMNDKVYGAVLVNSDVTIVKNDAVHRVLKGLGPTSKTDDKPEDKESINNEEEINYSQTFQTTQPNTFVNTAVDHEMDEKEKLLVLELWMMDQKIEEKTDTPLVSSTNVPTTDLKLQDNKTTKTKFICGECGRKFSKKHNYQQHLGTHFINQQRYECPICNRHFAWKSTVGKHMAREHGPRTEYSCDQCGKVYNSSIIVQYHIQRDHMNVRSHHCSKCNKSFFRKCDLKLHFRKHSNEKPYICGICGKRFRHSSNNLRHERLHLRNLSAENRTLANESIIEQSNLDENNS